MRSVAADRLIVLALVGLVLASVWLKSRAQSDAPAPPPRGALEQQIATRLAARGFALGTRRLPMGSILITGRRGACTVLARDASAALGSEVAFTREARDIGPVTYLYGGNRYSAPPMLWLRLDQLRRAAWRMLGSRRSVAMPVALAASPGCGDDRFGLADIILPG